MDITEQSLLSSVLKNPDVLINVVDKIKPDDFTIQRNKSVYNAMLALWQCKEPVDIVSVSKHVIGDVDVGWIASLTDSAPTDPVYCAQEIAEAGRKKRILARINAITDKYDFAPSQDVLNSLLNLYQSELAADKKPAHIKDCISRFYQVQEKNKQRGSFGIPTGFSFLERSLTQYCRGHVWTIGAYTSVGKTATMIEMISRVIDKAKILIISTEMTEEQNIARLIANKTGAAANVVLSGGMLPKHKEMADRAMDHIAECDLKIYDDIFTLSEIETVIRKAELQGGVDIVFLDYIQNVSVEGARSEYDAMQKLAKAIQKLAKQVKATIVCLSQIPNSAAKEDNGLLEFKGAGEIAAVSDVGIWLKRHKIDKTRILFDKRKNRHGPLCQTVLEYSNNWTKLNEVEE